MTKKKIPSDCEPHDEPTPFTAKEALRLGQAGPLSSFLEDTAQAQKLLADLIERLASSKTLATQSNAQDEFDEDWEASSSQFRAAIDGNAFELIVLKLRDDAEILEQISTALQPPENYKGQALIFKRASRGRPVDPFQKSQLKTKRKMTLRLKTRKLGKEDAALQEIKDEGGPSRATMYRAKSKARKKTNNK